VSGEAVEGAAAPSRARRARPGPGGRTPAAARAQGATQEAAGRKRTRKPRAAAPEAGEAGEGLPDTADEPGAAAQGLSSPAHAQTVPQTAAGAAAPPDGPAGGNGAPPDGPAGATGAPYGVPEGRAGGLLVAPRGILNADRVPGSDAVRVPAAKVALSTSSVYPESLAAAFEIARRLGYDGVELMVFTDPISQDAEAVRSLSEYYEVPVLSVHAPCLLVTQRVWTTDPWEKLRRSQAAAERLGASTIVVHPPFRWQRDYARDFEVGLERMRHETDITFAVENMYPWRARNREWAAYLPDWDPRNQDYPQVTLDLSHTSVSGTSAIDMAADLGDRLAHLHLADGSGLARDEHLVPGRGNQQCAEVLEGLAAAGFSGTIAVEVSTRKAANRAEREADLAEALAFARLHLAAPVRPRGRRG